MSTRPYKTINNNNYPIKVNDVSNKVNPQKKCPINFKANNPFQKNSSQYQQQGQIQRNNNKYMKVSNNKIKHSQNNKNDDMKVINVKDNLFKFENNARTSEKIILLKIMKFMEIKISI